ncbi:MAG: hypothetical protein N2491_09110, partial [Negativicutes bacterium]|nr:hypothetical protein [Negativicutes bacterium]
RYKAGWRRANSLVGRPYKPDDCDIRGAAAIFGKEFGEELAKCIAIDGTLNSSAVYTLVFRAMFPEFLQGRPLATITPQVAYEATVELLNI